LLSRDLLDVLPPPYCIGFSLHYAYCSLKHPRLYWNSIGFCVLVIQAKQKESMIKQRRKSLSSCLQPTDAEPGTQWLLHWYTISHLLLLTFNLH
jgi:hypothetical protein